MTPSIGLNLRVTGYKHQGGRKYMEDEFGVAYQQTADEKDLEYAFFGIFDGHGGKEAALFAKENLMDHIVRQKGFWHEDDDSVLKAIHEGFIQTHYAMWKELEKWPKTASGLPSTAGTTASIAFIRRGKIYIGHVGDSAIVLGAQDPDNPDIWRAEALTRDHKPESVEESERIQQCGGKVVCKSGVPRVVWNRPRTGHRGPVRRSTHIDEIPFLAVARSLGDLWSYNSEENVFVVSPEPDLRVYPVDITRHRCLILGTDGAWNMLTPQNAVSTVCQAEKANEAHMLNPAPPPVGVGPRPLPHNTASAWINPSKQLVDTAIDRWNGSKLRADNTSVVTVMLDPPGPPRAQVLKNRRRELAALNAGRDLPGLMTAAAAAADNRGSVALVTNTTPEEPASSSASSSSTSSSSSSVGRQPDHHHQPLSQPDNVNDPSSANAGGCSIISRFPNSNHPGHSAGYDLVQQKRREATGGSLPLSPLRDFQPLRGAAAAAGENGGHRQQQQQGGSFSSGRLSDSTSVQVTRPPFPHLAASAAAAAAALADSSSPASRLAASSSLSTTVNSDQSSRDETIQCNEVSSSEDSQSTAAKAAAATPPRPAAAAAEDSAVSTSPLSELNSSTPPTCSSSAAGRRKAKPGRRPAKAPLKESSSRQSSSSASARLSRELSGLQLSGGGCGPATRRSAAAADRLLLQRSRTRSESALSDVENDGGDRINRNGPAANRRSNNNNKITTNPSTSSRKAATVAAAAGRPTALRTPRTTRHQELTARIAAIEERRVATAGTATAAANRTLRTAHYHHQHETSATSTIPPPTALVAPHNLRSTGALTTPVTPRSLRSRGGTVVAGTTTTPAAAATTYSRRTVVAADLPSDENGTSSHPPVGGVKRRRPIADIGRLGTKSPRTVVNDKKPIVVTRSRQAKVLRLRK